MSELIDAKVHSRKRLHLQRPKERKGSMWNHEVVNGIWVGLSKGDWQTGPEK